MPSTTKKLSRTAFNKALKQLLAKDEITIKDVKALLAQKPEKPLKQVIAFRYDLGGSY